MSSSRIDYWNNFYEGKNVTPPKHPSQFAAFVLGETADATRLIEFGCGNGRDAAFFASHGLAVTALDASINAIELCQRRFCERNLKFNKFVLGESDIKSCFFDTKHVEEKTVLYARFFLHAISDEEEAIFLDLAQELIGPGSIIALEYRSSGDEENQKEFGQHFRRYLKHNDICDRVSKSGFDLVYQIEGRGFAKYKSEDALVGRCIAKRK